MSRRSLSDDERVLWRTVTRAITPLRGGKAEQEAAAALDRSPDERSDIRERNVNPAYRSAHAGYEARSAPRPPALAPIDRRMKQKLARGATSIDGRIDLHGLTQADAHAVLARFLRAAQSRGAKLVLVITGKGGGEGRGVLRRQVPLWLEGVEFRSLVIGFDAAGLGHGGEGALYVRVRRGR